MNEVIVFPDVTELVIGALRDQFPVFGWNAVVASVVPKHRPDHLVLVQRLGGPRLNLVSDQATLGVECWAPDVPTASELAQLCRALIHSLQGTVVDGVPVYRVNDIGGPAQLPDPVSTNPRFVFTVAVAARGEVVAGS